MTKKKGRKSAKRGSKDVGRSSAPKEARSTSQETGAQLSRAGLEAMSEAVLRTSVLIPLFKAMGFRDVHHHHGGSGEQGKDIVMWKPGALRDREDYGVVAKAGHLSGKATALRGTAAEAFFQIQQCLKSPYYDLLSLKDREIDRCFLVVSGTIKKEARSSLSAALGENRRIVDIIDGDRLWALVQQYLGARLMRDHLERLHSTLRTASDNYSIIAETGGDAITLSVRPKGLNTAAVAPLEFKGSFAFPDTPEGRAKLKGFEDHFRTGAEVRITKEFIADFQPPLELAELLGADITRVSEVVLGPRRPQESEIPGELAMVADDGTSATLSNFDWSILQFGTEQVRFCAVGKHAPFELVVVVNRIKQSITLTLKASMEGKNAVQQSALLRFMSVAAHGGAIHFRNRSNGISIVSGRVPPSVIGSQEAPEFIALVDELAAIQSRTATPLAFPTAGISVEEANTIHTTAKRVTDGQIVGTVTEFKVETEPGVGKEFVTALTTGRTAITVVLPNEVVSVLGHEIDLGQVVMVVQNVTISDEDRIRLEGDNQASHSVTLRCEGDNNTTMYYPRWMKESDRQLLPLHLRQ